MRRLVLYLDIDGVFLRGAKGALWNSNWEIAPHAATFLKWALKYHRPIWLTARDQDGNGKGVVAAFNNAAKGDFQISQIAASIPSRAWRGVKTNAIDFREDFLWLDDSPHSEDLITLERERCFQKWIEVNTDARPDDLLRVISNIEAKCHSKISKSLSGGNTP